MLHELQINFLRQIRNDIRRIFLNEAKTKRTHHVKKNQTLKALLKLAPQRAVGQLLATFLKDKERQIKEALVENDLPRARKLVNGGSNGLDRFEDAFKRGASIL